MDVTLSNLEKGSVYVFPYPSDVQRFTSSAKTNEEAKTLSRKRDRLLTYVGNSMIVIEPKKVGIFVGDKVIPIGIHTEFFQEGQIFHLDTRNTLDEIKVNGPPLPVSFLREQADFINSLSIKEYPILKSYTFLGDEIINRVLRGNVNPLSEVEATQLVKKHKQLTALFSSFINVTNIPSYVSSFMNIVKKSPVLKNTIVLYRGLRLKSNTTINQISNEIISATYNPEIVKNFIGENCCFMVIYVKPGVKALLMEDMSRFKDENEVIIIPPYSVNVRKIRDDLLEAIVSPVNYVRKAGTLKSRSKKAHKTRRSNK